ncbi:MAG: amidohydrolase [Bacteroidetes bacterium]|nr:amidohydrolase [Bacteroidota bacterium]
MPQKLNFNGLFPPHWLSLLAIGFMTSLNPNLEIHDHPISSQDALSTLIDGGIVVTMDSIGTILDGGAVLIKGDRIVDLLDADMPRPEASTMIDATGYVVIPGLINTHGHAAMSLFRGLADDLPLQTWLNEYIFPAEAALVSPDFVYWGTLLSSIEMLKSGTTTFTDMYFFTDDVVRATTTTGIRVAAGPVVIGFPTPEFPTSDESLASADQFMERYQNHPLVIPSISAHAIYTTPLDLIESAFQVAEHHNTVFQIHVLEDSTENTISRKANGMDLINALMSIDALRPGTILAHSVFLSADDIHHIAMTGAGIAHNPESNLHLGVPGVAPIPAALQAGIPVGLGTDGPAANNNLDLFEEMNTAAKIQKLQYGDPSILSAETTFRMATMGGARVLNMEKEIGSLEPGKRADIVLIDMQRAGLTPLYNIYSHLVYAVRGRDVSTVFVNGKKVVDQGKVTTVNEYEVISNANSFRDQVQQVIAQLRQSE